MRKIDGLLITDHNVSEILFNDNNENGITPITKKYSISSSDFLKNLNLLSNKSINFIDDNLLPRGTRFSFNINDMEKLFVVEQEPCIRSIFVDMDLKAKFEASKKVIGVDEAKRIYEKCKEKNENFYYRYRFNLSFPYLIWIIFAKYDSMGGWRLGKMNLYFKLSPIKSFDEHLIKPPLLNVNESCNICMGDAMRRGNTIDEQLGSFFNSIFNSEYNGAYNSYSSSDSLVVQNYFLWDYFTEKNPLFIFKEKWLYEGTLYENVKREKEDLGRSRRIRVAHLIDCAEGSLDLKESNLTEHITSCNSEILLNNHVLTVDEDIIINDRKCYVIAIIKEQFDQGTSTSIKVQYEDDDSIETIELTDDLIDDLDEQIERRVREKINVIESDGQEISENDYVMLMYDNKTLNAFYSNKFMKVKKIYNNHIMNMNELQIGNRRVFDVDELQLKKFSNELLESIIGKIPEPGDLFLCDSNIRSNPYRMFDRIDSNIYSFTEMRKGRNRIKFIFNDGTYIDDISKIKLIDDDVKIKSATIRSGLTMYNSSESIENGFVISEWIYPQIDSEGIYDISQAVNDVFKGDSVYLPSTDDDLQISIGDEIVVADWDNIPEMFKIREVVGFKFSLQNSSEVVDANSTEIDYNDVDSLLIQSKDSSGEERLDCYVDFVKSFVNVPEIRKVSREYGSYRVGDKVRATEAGISAFPKKDVNKIIAFITDTGAEEPIVLMSNTCTIWGSDLLEKFAKVHGHNGQLADLNITKIQPVGDMELKKYDDGGYMISFMDIEGPHLFRYGVTRGYIGRYKRKYGINNPRIKTSKVQEFRTQLIYNFRNVFYSDGSLNRLLRCPKVSSENQKIIQGN